MLLICSCAGYFPGHHGGSNPYNNTKASVQVERLGQAMEGGGFLSSDTANDITPFIFRDSSGNAYIFFASDRDGQYNIYYAGMDSDGKFFNLTKLGNDINTPGTASFSPVVIRYGGLTYLTYIQINGSTNIMCYQVDSGFKASSTNIPPYIYFSYDDGGSITSISTPMHLSGFTGPNNKSYLLVSSGTTNLYMFYFSSGWQSAMYYTFSANIYSASCWEQTSGPFFKDFIIAGVIPGSLNQLYGELGTEPTNSQLYGQAGLNTAMLFPSQPYSSAYNDAHPFMDQAGGYKVYFASDRYGKGNYDLYRYNNMTFDKEIPSSLNIPLDTVYVSPSGNNANDGLLPSSPMQTIGSAWSAAVYTYNINKIYAAQGLYTNEGSPLTISYASNLVIIGGFDPGFTYIAGQSILDVYNSAGTFYGEGLQIEYCSNITIMNFVIRNATNVFLPSSPYINSGGLLIYYSTNIIMANDVFSNNYAWFNAGIGTNANSGAGVFVVGGVGNSFVSCTITSNFSHYGAGMAFSNSIGNVVSSSSISSNYSDLYGGGVYFDALSSPNYIVSSTIIDNSASNAVGSGLGGGVWGHVNSVSDLFTGSTVILNYPDQFNTNNP